MELWLSAILSDFYPLDLEADPLFATCQQPLENGSEITVMGWPWIEESFGDTRLCSSIPIFRSGPNSRTTIYHLLLSEADLVSPESFS